LILNFPLVPKPLIVLLLKSYPIIAYLEIIWIIESLSSSRPRPLRITHFKLIKLIRIRSLELYHLLQVNSIAWLDDYLVSRAPTQVNVQNYRFDIGAHLVYAFFVYCPLLVHI